jgi:Multiubiquitin
MSNGPENPDHNKIVTIIVNGGKKQVPGKEVSYEAIVNLAYDNNPPTGPNVVITVTYSRGEDDKQGTLLPGKTVKIKNGMVFNAKATDRS